MEINIYNEDYDAKCGPIILSNCYKDSRKKKKMVCRLTFDGIEVNYACPTDHIPRFNGQGI